MMALGSFLLALAGFAALACAMAKHHRDLFGHAPSWRKKWRLRFIGWALLGLSLGIAISRGTPSIDLVLWTGLLTLAALIVALLLAYRTMRRMV